MAKIYWDKIKHGEELPSYSESPLSRIKIAKFAGATNDYSPLHIDDHFAKAEGFGGAFAHNLLSLAHAEQMLRHFADNIKILDLSGTFHKLVWPGDTLTAKGTVVKTYTKNGEHRMDVDLWVENQNQDMVMKGAATCLMFVSPAEEKKHKGSIPTSSAASKSDLAKNCQPFFKASKKPKSKSASTDL